MIPNVHSGQVLIPHHTYTHINTHSEVVMKECWREEAEKRPLFVALKNKFVQTLSEKNAYTHFITMEDSIPEEGETDSIVS